MKEYKITHKQLTKLLISSWKYNMIDDLGIDGLDESIEEITTEEIDEYIEETYSLHPTVSNEEAEKALEELEYQKHIELLLENDDGVRIRWNTIKQALHTPKISEDRKFGSDYHKLFVKNKKYKQLLDRLEIKREGLNFYVKGICYKEEISSYLYHDIKKLKSIGGNK